MRRLANVLFILCFTGFLAAVLLVTFRHVGRATFSEFENRNLAKAPEYSGEGFSDGSYLAGWESYFLDRAAGRDRLIKWNTLLHMDLMRQPVVNQVVVTDTGLLPYYPFGKWDGIDIPAQVSSVADELEALSAHVKELGGTLIYVGVPAQAGYYAEHYPAYLEHGQDFFPPLERAWAQALAARGIPYVDMPAIFAEAGHPREYFFTTDHHYTIYGALLTYQKLMGELNRQTGYDLAVLQADDLVYHTLPNPMLGSRNRMLYGLYPSRDRMTYALPKTPIPFTRTDNGKEVSPSLLKLPGNPTEKVGYTIFMGGDVGETILQTGRPQLPKALLVGDSYTNAVETLLYASFDETRALDLRHYSGQTLWDYLEKYRPQVVILLRDESVFIEESPNGTYR